MEEHCNHHLNRPELVKLGELNFDTIIDEEKIERAVDNLANKTIKKAKRPKSKKINDDVVEDENGKEA